MGGRYGRESENASLRLNVPQTFDQHMLGVGKVAEDGTAAKGEKAKGVLLELMVKASNVSQVLAPCADYEC